MTKDAISTLYDLFADLLEYPTLATPLKAVFCYERLKDAQPEASELLKSFYNEMEQRKLGQMQELYTVTFDMQPVCYPYVGYQLFGESYKRGAFMAQLNEAYHGFDYSCGQELPDHLAVILRFLGQDVDNREGEFCKATVNDGLKPALEKMLKTFGEQSENPYFKLLSALNLFLVSTSEKEFDHA
ncbi:MAG: molecular chaperone TorD family protein [Anaerolineales bacterium]